MTDCTLTLLPPDQCSHCTGSVLGFEPDERDPLIETIDERMNSYIETSEGFIKIRASEAVDASDRTIQEIYRQEHPRGWVSPQEIYAGGDDFVDGERVTEGEGE